METENTKTRIQVLRELNRHSNDDFYKYEQDCRSMILKLRLILAEYLCCPLDRIYWPNFSEESLRAEESNEGYISTCANKKMVLYSDTFYKFVFSIHVGNENEIQGDSIYIHLGIKKEGDIFVFRYYQTSFDVASEQEKDIEILCEYIYKNIKEFLETRFDKFKKSKGKNIGFVPGK